jgi:hypothetical protein
MRGRVLAFEVLGDGLLFRVRVHGKGFVLAALLTQRTNLKIELVGPGRIDRPIGNIGMRVVIVVPAGAPNEILGIDDVVASWSLDMPVGEQEIGSVCMTIGRPLGMALGWIGRIHVGVEADQGRILERGHITKHNHLNGRPDAAFFDWSLSQPAVYVAAKPELRTISQAQPPIVQSIGKSGCVGDRIVVRLSIQPRYGSKRRVDIDIPGRLGQRRWAGEGLPVAPHVKVEPRLPNVIETARGPDARGVLACVVQIHGVGNPQLPQIINARGLLGFILCLCQRGQKHRRQDGNDRDNNQQLDQSEGSLTAETLGCKTHTVMALS